MANSKFHRLFSTVASIFFTVVELVVSIILILFLGPVLLFLWLLNQLVRHIISIIFYCQSLNSQNPKLTLVSEGADAIWAFKKPRNSRNIIILYVYNSRMCVETFRKLFNENVIQYVDSNGVRLYEKLTKIFRKKYGFYCWEDSKAFDIRNHVRTIHGKDDEERIVTETEVLNYMSTLTGDMSEKQPQWEEIIVPQFAYDNDEPNGSGQIPPRSARIYRSHHAFMVISIPRWKKIIVRLELIHFGRMVAQIFY